MVMETGGTYQTYYVTTAANHPRGAGYWEVHAPNEEAARVATNRALEGKWAFMYRTLDEVHPLDRHRHGRIG